MAASELGCDDRMEAWSQKGLKSWLFHVVNLAQLMIWCLGSLIYPHLCVLGLNELSRVKCLGQGLAHLGISLHVVWHVQLVPVTALMDRAVWAPVLRAPQPLQQLHYVVNEGHGNHT